tara:strand:+ start:1192 stop:1326 length:135 start_codon:yes stop_codon:yes gene_type:complete
MGNATAKDELNFPSTLPLLTGHIPNTTFNRDVFVHCVAFLKMEA